MINSNPIYRRLKEVNIKWYNKIWDFWIVYINNITELSLESKLIYFRYKKKFPNSDLYKIKDIKYIIEAITRLTRNRLDKRVIVKSVRDKIRKLLLI